MTIYVSASQIKMHRECKRKIGHRYNDKREDKGSPKTWFGKEVHRTAENYLKTGVVPDEHTVSGKAVRKLMGDGWLPVPSNKIVSEGEINFESGIPGVILTGYIDIVDPRGLPEVDDIKTSSDKQYALTPEEFDDDPQVLMYGKYAADRWGGGWAKMKWLYVFIKWTKDDRGVYVPVGVKGRHKVETIINVNSRGFQEKWAALLADVAEIAATRLSKPPTNSLEMDAGSCSNFGGCPFKPWCDRPAGKQLSARLKKYWTAHRRITKKEEVSDVGFNDRLAAIQAAKAAKTGGAAPAETVLETKPPADAPKTEAKPEAAATLAKAGSALATLQAKAKDVKVNPPVETPKISPEAAERNKDLMMSPEELAAQKAQEPAAEAPKEAKPAKADKKPTAAKTEIKANRVVIFNASAHVTKQHSIPTVVNLHEVLQELTDHINTEHNVSHWSHVEFGKGRGLLAALLDEVLTKGKWDYSTILADTSSQETQAVYDVLVKHAGTIIRGY